MKIIIVLTLFFSAFFIAQNNYHPGHYIDVDNRKFDLQIKQYNFDEEITSLDYKENNNEQAFSLPIDQVELFTYKKNREIFVFREVNMTNENGAASYENSKKILVQLIASGKNTSLFYRKYQNNEDFFYMDNFKEINRLVDSTYKQILSNDFKSDEEKFKVYSFDKVSLTLLINYINSYDLSKKISDKKQSDKKIVKNNENLKVPVFAGCNKNLSKEELMKCLNNSFSKHFSSNFVFPESIKDKYPNFNSKIFLYFIIEKDGTISLRNVINTSSNDLIIELYRVFSLMPKITPATKDNNAVKSKYSMPIILKLG